MTSDYDPVLSSRYRYASTGEDSCLGILPVEFQAVKAAYTAGWTSSTLPKDLRQAIIDIIGTKLIETANYPSSGSETATTEGDEESTTPTGLVKRIQADSYSVEFSTAQTDAYWKSRSAHSIGDSVPAGAREIISRYRRPFAL